MYFYNSKTNTHIDMEIGMQIVNTLFNKGKFSNLAHDYKISCNVTVAMDVPVHLSGTWINNFLLGKVIPKVDLCLPPYIDFTKFPMDLKASNVFGNHLKL